jgi:hypothetical protein
MTKKNLPLLLALCALFGACTKTPAEGAPYPPEKTPSLSPAESSSPRPSPYPSPSLEYEDAGDIFTEGMLPVKRDGKWGFIDTAGREAIPCKYDFLYVDHGVAEGFREGVAMVGNWKNPEDPDCLERLWGLIDKTGREVVPMKYSWIDSFPDADPIRAILDGNIVLLDKTGREIAAFKADTIGFFGENDIARIGIGSRETGWQYGYIDKTGREIVPCIYTDAWDVFSEGLAAVQKDGKWGFIDMTGRMALPFTYDDVTNNTFYHPYGFYGGAAAVKKDGKWGLIDKTGRELTPFIYYHIGSLNVGEFIKVGSSWPGIKWGVIDRSGREIIPLEYDDIHWYVGDEGVFSVGRGEWGDMEWHNYPIDKS